MAKHLKTGKQVDIKKYSPLTIKKTPDKKAPKDFNPRFDRKKSQYA